MGRKRKGRAINGVLIVDKPQGISSNDVVQRVKRIYKSQKAGHTGALDPLATGLLPVCLGEATKFSQFLLDADKSYFVSAILGERTDTSDADGEIVETKPVNVTENDIRAALGQFSGQIKQVPSMFSALKHEGKPLYYYARQGITIERPARDITIYDIEWVSLENNVLSLNVQCSKGTYIRSLIDDLGQLLGCGAHVSVLRRTEVAHYKSAQMYTFEQLESLQEEDKFSHLDDILLPMDTAIASLTKRVVSEQEAIQFCLGQAVSSIDLSSPRLNEGEVVRLYEDTTQRFLGVATVNEMNLLQPKRVVVYASDTLEA